MRSCKNCTHYGSISSRKKQYNREGKLEVITIAYCDPEQQLREALRALSGEYIDSKYTQCLKVCEAADTCEYYKRSWWRIWADR